jgi:hypothetical protein
MAYTKDDVKYVRLESVQIWAADDGSIHLTSDDPDARGTLHTYISNNPGSKRYHPAAYRQFARILTKFNKEIPGWDPAADTD